MRRKYRYTAPRCGMISRPLRRLIAVRLLRRTRWIRAIIIVRRWLTLRKILVTRYSHTWSRLLRIPTGWIVFPHVNTSLRRTSQFANIIDRVVGTRIWMLIPLSYQLALRQKTSLRTVPGVWYTRHLTLPNHTHVIVMMLHIVVRWSFGYTYKVGPTYLRRCAWIWSENTSNFY